MIKIIKKFGMPYRDTRYCYIYENIFEGCSIFLHSYTSNTKSVVMSNGNRVEGHAVPDGIYILRPFQYVPRPDGRGRFRIKNDYPAIRKHIAAKFRAMLTYEKDTSHE